MAHQIENCNEWYKIVHCSIQLMIVVTLSDTEHEHNISVHLCFWTINPFINENPESFRTLHNKILISEIIKKIDLNVQFELF